MKKTAGLSVLLSLLGLYAQAQIIINESAFQGRMSEIRTAVIDSLTGEPLSFASVYVTPVKDTVITNFTLTDVKGAATLEEVPYGGYVFHVEMMGYKPFVRERWFREAVVDLGTVRLQPDKRFLEAAVVSDVGNPIIMKKDTVEFNASSFLVGTNAMLRDLLKRMPGMEVSDDGKVRFNGEAIDKLTVGGRTFFFNDQSMALNNLPASIVDKIRVIDRASESARATGLEDGTREKVLDVALKKEYEQGWFGNAGLKGGATAGAKKEDALRDDRGLLYSANALVSAYTEKDQVTVIANGQNVDDSNMIAVLTDADGNQFSSMDFLSDVAQLGVNTNTSRIKGVETTVSANYKYSDSDSGARTARTTFQEDGDLFSLSDNAGKQYANTLNANLEFQREKGNVWFHLRPHLQYYSADNFDAASSETSREGLFVNRSENTTRRRSRSIDAGLSADLTFRDLFGKNGRSFQLGFGTGYKVSSGESDEQSRLETAAVAEQRRLFYDIAGNVSSLNGSLRYSEPFGDKWLLAASASLARSRNDNVRDASDAEGRNEWYSSESRNHYVKQEYGLTSQYKFGETGWITLGGTLMGVLNETWSKSFGVGTFTGKEEWIWSARPVLRFQYNKGYDRFTLSSSGYSQRPSVSNMLPVLNISNPARLTLGNVYLRPSTNASFNVNWSRNNRERFSNLMISLGGRITTDPVTSALWYDDAGILYSIPVNARKPYGYVFAYGNYTIPLNESKTWSFSLYNSDQFTYSSSYLPQTALSGLDKDRFDYSQFMEAFWGDAGGDRFYGGQSGFYESVTRQWYVYVSAGLTNKGDRHSVRAGGNLRKEFSRYASDTGTNTLDSGFYLDGTYTTRREFQFNSYVGYHFYKGYTAGFRPSRWEWNAEISKNIGAFNLSVKAKDILNQQRYERRTVTANYEEDSVRLVMGRYILFGVKWNFGKMNAAHNQRAQSAAMNMMW